MVMGLGVLGGEAHLFGVDLRGRHSWNFQDLHVNCFIDHWSVDIETRYINPCFSRTNVKDPKGNRQRDLQAGVFLRAESKETVVVMFIEFLPWEMIENILHLDLQ